MKPILQQNLLQTSATTLKKPSYCIAYYVRNENISASLFTYNQSVNICYRSKAIIDKEIIVTDWKI